MRGRHARRRHHAYGLRRRSGHHGTHGRCRWSYYRPSRALCICRKWSEKKNQYEGK